MASHNVFLPDKGMFFIVNLHTNTGEYVAVIPDFWLEKEGILCVYPKSRGEFSVQGRKPRDEEKWFKYSCTKRAEFESYKDAKTWIPHAQKHSDFNSESEHEPLGKGKRHKRQRTAYSPSPDLIGSSEEEGFFQQGSSHVKTPIVPPTLQDSYLQSMQTTESLQVLNGPFSLPHSNASLSVDSDLFCSSPMVNSSSRPTAAVDSGFENVRSSPNGRSSVLSSTDSGFGSYYTAPREIANTPSLLTSSIGVGGALVRYEPAAEKNTMEFHRLILKQLAKLSQNSALQASVIEARMNDIDAKLKAFVDQPHERRAEVDAATTSVVMPTLPIPSMEMLLTFEDMLINDDIRFELSRIVKAGGGITLADAVKRAWLKSLSLQVRALCNWCGKPRKGIQKHKLEGSRVTGAVFRGIRSITQFKNSTDAELEHETKKVFKHAPERARNHGARGDDDDDGDDRGNILERPVAGKSTHPSDPRPPRAGGSTSI